MPDRSLFSISSCELPCARHGPLSPQAAPTTSPKRLAPASPPASPPAETRVISWRSWPPPPPASTPPTTGRCWWWTARMSGTQRRSPSWQRTCLPAAWVSRHCIEGSGTGRGRRDGCLGWRQAAAAVHAQAASHGVMAAAHLCFVLQACLCLPTGITWRAFRSCGFTMTTRAAGGRQPQVGGAEGMRWWAVPARVVESAEIGCRAQAGCAVYAGSGQEPAPSMPIPCSTSPRPLDLFAQAAPMCPPSTTC